MESVKDMIGKLVEMYWLVQMTDGETSVDFDNATINYYEFNVNKFDTIAYAQNIGIISNYEDEFYFVNQDKVDELKNHLKLIEKWYTNMPKMTEIEV